MATARKRPAEICTEFGIQPFVLKFWESEFPSLGKRLGPKRGYGPVEREMVREIHRLVEQDRCTLAEARRQIEERFGDESEVKARRKGAAPRPRPVASEPARDDSPQLEEEMKTLAHQLDRANEELDEMRAQLKEMRAERDRAQKRVGELASEVSACILEANEIVAETEATLMKLAPSHRPSADDPSPTPVPDPDTGQPPLFPGRDA